MTGLPLPVNQFPWFASMSPDAMLLNAIPYAVVLLLLLVLDLRFLGKTKRGILAAVAIAAKFLFVAGMAVGTASLVFSASPLKEIGMVVVAMFAVATLLIDAWLLYLELKKKEVVKEEVTQ